MNQKENDKQFHLRKLLRSMECRLSISQVNDRPVQTGFALVEVEGLSSGEIQFVSELLLPDRGHVTFSLEFVFEEAVLKFQGSKLHRCGESAPYRYQLEYEMNRLERSMLFAKINHLMEASQSAVTKAIASYASFYSYYHFTPGKVFQT
ncbi:hypothetical protein N0M98_27750 [Paenibacillus doosanensis]|uniref:PilZ domain-containing protein n=1 Tax=Paenibacillus konkukensis TaxID=2020716 RepID=A0ABY4RVI2_9BACL|nr:MULTISPECIES: hypothetical protein [Paenibacillus]MCS7463907.1 hypothetical protein [Paenibacillus doosanensis]UQZ85774.1 hypothetical protein SK3146_05063 [Paenibacillus konkukensis]